MCNNKPQLEVTGYIQKEELLTTVEGKIIENTLVLENHPPFPGYHGENLPDEDSPRSLFFILNEKYSFEDIARKTKNVREKIKSKFNASEGTIYIHPYEYNCLRIKYLCTFKLLKEVQKQFKEEGIKYSRYKDINKEAIIKINKVFFVEEQEEGIYWDCNIDSKYYIELPEKISWDNFKQYTFNLKNNLDNINFDAALGVFYRRKEIVDVIRIYDTERTIERASKLKNMYWEEIRRSYK
jgi:hypothetical protein